MLSIKPRLPAYCYSIAIVLLAAALSVSASANSQAATQKTHYNSEQQHYVTFKTDLGTLIIKLYPKKAPITVANFLAYVDSGFYNGVIFHRVIPSFVIQGGGYTYDFQRKPTRDPIKNESDNGLKNQYLTLSMARTNDPDSATSQFFINLKHNESLDAQKDKPGYAVFGKVVKGEKTIEKIVAEPRGMFDAFPDAPNAAVRILHASRGKHPPAPTHSKLKDMIVQ